MRVRVVKKCIQPLSDGDRHKYMRPGEIHEWNRDCELPSCFVEIGESDDTEESAGADPQAAAPPSLHALDRDRQIEMALNELDKSDLTLWTSQGLPFVDAVSFKLEELGFDMEVTRAEINVAYPGFNRL